MQSLFSMKKIKKTWYILTTNITDGIYCKILIKKRKSIICKSDSKMGEEIKEKKLYQVTSCNLNDYMRVNIDFDHLHVKSSH